MKKLCFLVLLFSTGFSSITCSKRNSTNPETPKPDSITISYLADDVSIFPNPERGWFASQGFQPEGGGIPENNTKPHDPVTLAALQTLKSNGITLVRDVILVGNMTSANAFDGSLQARIGFHSDSFLGDENSWATYTQPNEKTYSATETLYVPQTGELSAETDYNKNKNNVLGEMSRHHYTSFNYDAGDCPGVYVAWKNNGAYEAIARRLGYRFRLISVTQPKITVIWSDIKMCLRMANDGWAGIMNPRRVEIIFKNKTTGEIFVMGIDGDGRGNRLWLPRPGETKVLVISEPLPMNIPLGEYDLFLNLPDPYPSLYGRPEYSIRLANKDIWDAMTGYNNLLSGISIK